MKFLAGVSEWVPAAVTVGALSLAAAGTSTFDDRIEAPFSAANQEQKGLVVEVPFTDVDFHSAVFYPAGDHGHNDVCSAKIKPCAS